MAKRKNNASHTFSEEWDYIHAIGVRAHIACRAGTSTFVVTFSNTGKLKLTNGEYELKTDSKYIPHSIIDQIIADDIAAVQREQK